MTFHVLGIGITSPQGQTWTIAPVLSGLESAEGGLETGLGWFGVKWNVKKNILTVEISTPRVTSGTVTLPGTGEITVNGRLESGGTIELRGGDHILMRRLSLSCLCLKDSICMPRDVTKVFTLHPLLSSNGLSDCFRHSGLFTLSVGSDPCR